jgi:hypothetical protein
VRLSGSVLVALMMATAGCGEAQPTAPAELGPLVRNDRVEQPVVQVHFSGYAAPVAELITTAPGWSSAWATLHARLEPEPPLPAVDLDTHALVLFGLGSQTQGAHPRVDRLAVHERGILLNVTIEVPGRECVILAVITQPALVMQIPRPPATAGRVMVMANREVRDCT